MNVKKIKVTKVKMTIGSPKKDCPRCYGTGVVNGMHCACTIIFGKEEEEEVLVAVEQTPNGGVKMDFQEIKQ